MHPLILIPTIKDYIWGGTRLSKEFDILSFTDTNGKLLALKPDVTLSIIKNFRASEGIVAGSARPINLMAGFFGSASACRLRL